MSEQAAMLPLDFSGSRRELSTLYMSDDWSLLQLLLQDPSTYLRDRGFQWVQDPPGSTQAPWILMHPATAVMQWIGSSTNVLISAGAALPKSFYQKLSSEPLAEGSLSGAEATGILREAGENSEVDVRSALNDTFPNGVFIASFALETHSLQILYHPPSPGVRRFKGQYTNCTLTLVPSPLPQSDVDLSTANLHFDIGHDAKERAEFVMDYIEDWAKVLYEAATGGPDPFTIGTANFVPPPGPIVIVPGEPGIVPEMIPPNPKAPYPTVIVEGLSRNEADAIYQAQQLADEFGCGDPQPAACFVCIEVNGVYSPPTEGTQPIFNPGATVVKCYNEAAPSPGSSC